jgi:hypothetical protein
MHTFAQKMNEPQPESSPQRSRLISRTIENQAEQALPQANAEGRIALPGTPAPTHFAHDFSRIPVSAKAPVSLRAKLMVNTPGDIYEQEADRVAEQVTRISEPQLQRACACGGGCPTCRNEQGAHEHLQTKHVHEVSGSSGQPLDSSAQGFMESRFGHDFSRVRVHRNDSGSDGLSDVHRSTIHSDKHGIGKTNRRFENFAITARDLSDPDIIARLNALSKVGLIEYRRKVKDLAVSDYITNLIDKLPALPPCTTEEGKETSKQAEAARVASLPLVADAVRALGGVATSALLCAFASNFNTPGDAPEFQTRRLIVAKRLAALSSVMKTAVPFSCVPADDTVCMRPGKGDTVAYVVGHKPPIKFCPSFRSLADDMTSVQSAIVTHEYAHLVGGIDDAGGYAANGPQFGSCTVNSKFKAQGDVLINTADALTGFVMHIGLGLTPAASAPTPAPGPTGAAAASEKTGTAEATPSPKDSDEPVAG